MTARAARWGNEDRYFGPLTFSRSWRHWAAVLTSTNDEGRPCTLRLTGFGGRTLIVALPAIIDPWRQWVDTSKYAWEGNPKGGYWDIHERAYGFSLSDGHLNIMLGAQTHDSSTTQDWGCFLPWTQWRHVRRSFYGLDGELISTVPRPCKWDVEHDMADACPTKSFAFGDYDGERLSVTTKIEEREWRFGEGWFKWLSLFRRPRIRRSLDLRFSGETGKRKGSWKGGTIGHAIEMQPGELHEVAFRRYCAENRMSFIG